jgi:hypothetical protein
MRILELGMIRKGGGNFNRGFHGGEFSERRASAEVGVLEIEEKGKAQVRDCEISHHLGDVGLI